MRQTEIDIQAQKLSAETMGAFVPVQDYLEELEVFGYALLVNYTVLGYEHFHSTYPIEWQNEYDSRHYHVLDPVMIWALCKEGVCRWSETRIPDTRGVHKKAAKHGLHFGGIWSRKTGNKKSVLFVGRSDREFNDEELDHLTEELELFFDSVTPTQTLSPKEIAAVKQLAEGQSVAEAAAQLLVSESAIKERIASARKKLKCKNTAQLVFRAAENGFLS